MGIIHFLTGCDELQPHHAAIAYLIRWVLLGAGRLQHRLHMRWVGRAQAVPQLAHVASHSALLGLFQVSGQST